MKTSILFSWWFSIMQAEVAVTLGTPDACSSIPLVWVSTSTPTVVSGVVMEENWRTGDVSRCKVWSLEYWSELRLRLDTRYITEPALGSGARRGGKLSSANTWGYMRWWRPYKEHPCVHIDTRYSSFIWNEVIYYFVFRYIYETCIIF